MIGPTHPLFLNQGQPRQYGDVCTMVSVLCLHCLSQATGEKYFYCWFTPPAIPKTLTFSHAPSAETESWPRSPIKQFHTGSVGSDACVRWRQDLLRNMPSEHRATLPRNTRHTSTTKQTWLRGGTKPILALVSSPAPPI